MMYFKQDVARGLMKFFIFSILFLTFVINKIKVLLCVNKSNRKQKNINERNMYGVYPLQVVFNISNASTILYFDNVLFHLRYYLTAKK